MKAISMWNQIYWDQLGKNQPTKQLLKNVWNIVMQRPIARILVREKKKREKKEDSGRQTKK